ncbi:MAG: 5'/3'-nucleotidase SurE [Bacteroidales bacterium]|nr:5'/3'-nucleotidase SurE [Bacteroidales bacterium]
MNNLKSDKLLILVTNDDGLEAKGIKELVNVVRPLGRVVVVAPSDPQSGMSHAITVKNPLRVKKMYEENDLVMYKCNGTPVDCVKIACNQLLKEKPGLLVAGINHGSNSSTSVFYSGTLGATLEGCINEIPSIGFSLLSLDSNADFTAAKSVAGRVISKVMENGLPRSVCLNVNIPNGYPDEIKGIRICRQNKGFWREEFDKRTDPMGKHYFWLTGYYHNSEPEADDTDEWALRNAYVSVVPIQTDLTAYTMLDNLRQWKL